MSLVPSYALCTDGKYYRNPVWRSPNVDGLHDWFICLDDDDPPELVVQDDKPTPEFTWFATGQKPYTGALRVFGANGRTMLKAKAYFGRLVEVPPPPQDYDSVADHLIPGDKVIFDVERWKKRFPAEYEKWRKYAAKA